MRGRRIAVLVAGLAALLAVAASAMAATSGTIKLYVSATGAKNQRIVIVGAIGDYGPAISVNADGTPNQNGNYELLKLHKGSILVNSASFNKAGDNPRPVVRSNATCSAAFAWSGRASIVSGTGAYAGITGSVTLHGVFAGITGRYKSGAHKGQCLRGNNAPGVGQFSLTGSGHVSY